MQAQGRCVPCLCLAADAPPYAAKRITFAANLAPNATLNLGGGLTIAGAARGTTGLYAVRAGSGLVFAPFDGSGAVGGEDLALLLGSWGQCG